MLPPVFPFQTPDRYSQEFFAKPHVFEYAPGHAAPHCQTLGFTEFFGFEAALIGWVPRNGTRNVCRRYPRVVT
jgi:hypothetical protein